MEAGTLALKGRSPGRKGKGQGMMNQPDWSAEARAEGGPAKEAGWSVSGLPPRPRLRAAAQESPKGTWPPAVPSPGHPKWMWANQDEGCGQGEGGPGTKSG